MIIFLPSLCTQLILAIKVELYLVIYTWTTNDLRRYSKPVPIPDYVLRLKEQEDIRRLRIKLMEKEDFKKKVDDMGTAYAEKGDPQPFGNNLLLQNIDAFSTIGDLNSRVQNLEKDIKAMSMEVRSLQTQIDQMLDKL